MFFDRLKKFVAAFLIAALFVSQTVRVDIRKIRGREAQERYSLVALVVEENLYKGTLRSKIQRYASDIQKTLAYTKPLVITVGEEDSVVKIQQVLERLYFEGDGAKNEQNNLVGVVLVGDVPVPMVGEEGEEFVSMYPYTDFIKKAYIYNFQTNQFEKNDLISESRPEIWHGVIRPPVGGVEGAKLLSEYFDRNHDFYEGKNSAALFDKKVFYADFLHEKESLSEDVYEAYLRQLGSWEDIMYNRYTSAWADALQGAQEKDLKDEGLGSIYDAAQGGMGNVKLPDIHAFMIIQNFFREYYEVAWKYLADLNVFVENSG
ncbi:MAG TPA: hypothetical protein ENI70_00150, partial [Candidatus Peregrinibacteria bacterium]|nr:hypothetical protein [Candidatus Peregrinibacteria bacterium]